MGWLFERLAGWNGIRLSGGVLIKSALREEGIAMSPVLEKALAWIGAKQSSKKTNKKAERRGQVCVERVYLSFFFCKKGLDR